MIDMAKERLQLKECGATVSQTERLLDRLQVLERARCAQCGLGPKSPRHRYSRDPHYHRFEAEIFARKG